MAIRQNNNNNNGKQKNPHTYTNLRVGRLVLARFFSKSQCFVVSQLRQWLSSAKSTTSALNVSIMEMVSIWTSAQLNVVGSEIMLFKLHSIYTNDWEQAKNLKSRACAGVFVCVAMRCIHIAVFIAKFYSLSMPILHFKWCFLAIHKVYRSFCGGVSKRVKWNMRAIHFSVE